MNNIIKETSTALKVFIGFSILLGLVYPLSITAIAQLTMPDKANGSLIKINNKIVGSKLIGQEFKGEKYFNSRPSAVDYNAAGSGGSNLGPTSKKLIDLTTERLNQTRKINNISGKMPADMVLASASGLDPHISIKNALLQIPRISKTRNISEAKLKELVDKNTDPDFIGIWGQAGVNVLKVNIDLDKLSEK